MGITSFATYSGMCRLFEIAGNEGAMRSIAIPIIGIKHNKEKIIRLVLHFGNRVTGEFILFFSKKILHITVFFKKFSTRYSHWFLSAFLTQLLVGQLAQRIPGIATMEITDSKYSVDAFCIKSGCSMTYKNPPKNPNKIKVASTNTNFCILHDKISVS